MDSAEFDKFADEYLAVHARNIVITGEQPEFFAEYKVRDVHEILVAEGRAVARILDFGAGIGNSAVYFWSYFAEARLVCVGVSLRSLVLGRQGCTEGAEFVAFDGATLPFADGSVDLAFAGCVFHHIPHEKHGPILKELRRVLAAGGMLSVFEHNPLNPLTVHAVQDCPFDVSAVLIRAGAMRARLRQAGFELPSLRYRIFFPHALRGLRRLERRLARLPLGAQYHVFATR
jgi:SAM-dependent methyltransferase